MGSNAIAEVDPAAVEELPEDASERRLREPLEDTLAWLREQGPAGERAAELFPERDVEDRREAARQAWRAERVV